ncbi:CBS domain-containing protein [bacterium]|nr:CBS domain-containing protein [bacterium]
MGAKPLKDVRFATCSDVMTKDVVYIDGKKSVKDAIKMMRNKKVSSLIVNRRSQDDAWGILCRKDVVNKVVDPGLDPSKVPVYEIMSKPLVMVSPGFPLKYCARLFNKARIRRAPVFDGTNIIGMISNTDIFNAVKI